MTAAFTELLAFLGLYWFIPVVIALAVFSLTRIIVADTLFDGIRNKFFDRFPHEGYTTKAIPKRGEHKLVSGGYHVVTKGTKLGYLVSCPWCSGFYVAAAVTVALLISPLWTTLALFPLALRVIPALFPGWD